jgi:hypothetical protein
MHVRTALIISAMMLSASAIGHELANGPHGGRVVEAGDYHVELVARENLVEVFLTDIKDKPIVPVGFKGVAILVIGGKSTRIPLEPTTTSSLLGKTGSTVSSEPKGVVQITAPNGSTAQARFN